MNGKMQRAALAAAIALGAATVPARAADALYTVEASFVAAAPGTVVESFESLAGTLRALDPIGTTLLTITTASTPIGVQTGNNTPNDDFGAFATDGTHYVSVYLRNLPQGSIVFTLPAASTAFGLKLTDMGETSGTVTLTTNAGAYASGGLVLSFPPIADSGTTHFAGLTQDTPFTTVTLTVTGVDEAYGLDAVRVLSAVPEPASALMLLPGLAWLGARRRR